MKTVVKKYMLLAVSAAIVSQLAGASLPPDVKYQGNGTLRAGSANFTVTVFNKKWHNVENRRWKDTSGKVGRNGGKYSGNIFLDSSIGKGEIEYTPVTSDTFDIASDIEFTPALDSRLLTASWNFPAKALRVEVDGKAIDFTKESKQNRFYGKYRQCTVYSVGNLKYIFSAKNENSTLHIQDNRSLKTPVNTVSLRFHFAPSSGKISKSTFAMRCQITPGKLKSVDLTPYTNCNMTDDPESGKPGWTNQGSEADFSCFTAQKVTAQGITFTIPERKVIAVGATLRKAPAECTVKLPETKNMRAIHLLHNSAWTPAGELGKMLITYADNSKETITLAGTTDCGNWVGPSPKANAAVAWQNINELGRSVGLYVSSFALQKSDPKEIRFIITDKRRDPFWAIFAVTLGEFKAGMPQVSDRTIIHKKGNEWKELTFSKKTIKGSALDFSFLLDAPAGKYGWAYAEKDGTIRFEKAPGKRLKLNGTNMCQTACFPSKESAHIIAENLAALGYNAVRFHHHDAGLTDLASGNSTTLNKDNLDKLEYFIHVLKEKGFYITTDLYTSRKFHPDENFPKGVSAKALFPLDRKAMDNWKTFARNWMTHVNPYTGTSLAEDPALVAINLVNEDNLESVWNSSSGARRLYSEKFEEYKKTNNIPEAKAESNDRHFLKFLVETQTASLNEMADFVRKELKMKCMLTSLNFRNDSYLTAMRSKFDLVDTHMYHSHPSFVGKSWASARMYGQSNPLTGVASLPRSLMSMKNPGKPFWVTEYNYCSPNRYRAVGGPLMGAYPALQDWDGLFRFCYNHNIKRIDNDLAKNAGFEEANEVVMLLANRVVAAMFLRGDVSKAKRSYSCELTGDVTSKEFQKGYPGRLSFLGLVSGTGSHPKGAEIPAHVTVLKKAQEFSEADSSAKVWKQAVSGRTAVSDTGEIKINAKKETFVVNSPLSESITFNGGNLSTGGILALSKARYFQSASLISLDGKPLKESRRMVLIHIGDAASTGTVHVDRGGMTMIKVAGDFPHLIRNVSAKVSLKLDENTGIKVNALGMDGKILGSVKVENNSFDASAGLFPGGVVAYEITR